VASILLFLPSANRWYAWHLQSRRLVERAAARR